jgi:predicted SprT family Zn-dependent metalloprotease
MAVDRTSGPSELVAIFNKLNARHFNNSLKATLEWSSRMSVIAGNCYWEQGVIRLSEAYHREHPEQIEATMLHEMLHLALKRGHDAQFRQAAAALGVPMRAQGKAQHRPYLYVYACPNCGRTVRRRRTGVWACGICGKGRYQEKYRLQIVEYLT